MPEVVKVLAYSKSVEILSSLDEEGKKKFSDISNELNLNPNIVNKRLKDLTEKELAKKSNGQYRVTEKGSKALKLVKELESI